MVDLCNFDDFWKQKPDATGKLGLLSEQKMTGALQMLVYGAWADQCDEVTRMGASTALKCLKKFCAQVEYLYEGWSKAFSGRKGYPTVILEAVASYDTHVWHGFFSNPGAQNDLNVASNMFARVINGSALEVAYKVNDSTYSVPYYLIDGIYPR
ncbi:PREDICTED: uncharacterized protein LOC101314112 [Fragaria vesca subsp. vesca]|uniref:uncharacterized protein LOC101314112 n=1 Tax=Fragaria vesca subsp. vesca TaxID=101020 RepID=UPI0002C2E14F|nr:PREDICTED: uncharacterized protein LOC101314112 [Fragaria vesca subsp. vesca]